MRPAFCTGDPRITVDLTQRPPLDEVPDIVACREAIEQELGDDGRVVLRYSGTENLCRVMVEGPDREVVDARAAELAKVVERSLGA